MPGVFEAGMAAEIEVNGQAEKYSTRIEEVLPSALVVAAPMKQREYIELENGRRIMLSVMRRNNPYFFETVVTGTEWNEGQKLIQVRRPADNAGVQMRQHVRVAVTITDASFWAEGEDGKFGPTVPGSVLDISAGGLQGMTKEGLPEKGKILARIPLSRQHGTLMASAVVLRDYERVSDVGVRTHRCHCEFFGLADKDRERLIRFVMERERELRRRGVL